MIRFQQIRNATVKLCYPNATFLIDPWLSPTFTPEERDAALHEHRFIEKPICPLPASPEKILSGVDYILVTHLHADHFSPDFLPPDAPMVFQSQEDAEAVKKTGFIKTAFFTDGLLSMGGVTVYRVEARHGDTDEQAKRAGPASGFVFVKEGEPTIYLAGDTVFTENVRDVIRHFSPAVVIVNACDARGRYGRLIMNTEDVLKTCACSPAVIVIATHMDTVSHAHLSRAQLHANLEERPGAEQVLIPEDGEWIEIA
jgi:L-ascorbate metabolism protein UlaG (beta-lactamase superfamily)